MSKTAGVSFATTLHIRDNCLCLHVQRAARTISRRFDEALRPLGLTSGQFSLLASLNRAQPARIGSVAALLGMDRTTLTAALKPLQQRGLVDLAVDPDDQRGRIIALAPAGRALLSRAVPIWKRTNRKIEQLLAGSDADEFRQGLRSLS